MTLTVGSLFSGIGGLDLGLERAGLKVIWQSEIDPYCNKVLKKHWPKVLNHGNIKDIDWGTVERPNVICGGYPCQPFSGAGKRLGTDDPRHLWPWVRTAISEIRPDYAILENVRGHVTMGGTAVIGDLADIGYDAQWRVVSAAGMGAPHRRDRLIIVAYPTQLHGDVFNNYPTSGMEPRTSTKLRNNRRAAGVAQRTSNTRTYWSVEPNMGRMVNGVPNRVDRLRGLGNAVVPQVAEYVGRLIVNTQ
jgi:DNA (cytosine-5)-methyltransferase 1